ncbi:MAG: hypothetical protein PHU16_06495 [Atribacterota bacterium]|nr:hypothetical protein [Atribacterota bacterium]
MSKEEIERDKNKKRRDIALSKIGAYATLENPPDAMKDEKFIDMVGRAEDSHEMVDINLLYCIYREATQYLITEDKGIHKKASVVKLSDRVLTVKEAIEKFEGFLPIETVQIPPSLMHVPLHNLDIQDPFFDSLKKEYHDFEDWWTEKSREGRKAWVYFRENGKIGAILILKTEDEAIPSVPPLPRKKRVKVCTLKVEEIGHKIGELFIKISIRFAINNQLDELYLTHYTKPEGDHLVDLIEEFGFKKVSEKETGEYVYVKSIHPHKDNYGTVEIAKQFYPGFYDGVEVKKFLVPIQPQHHNRLFIDCSGRQTSLFELAKRGGELITEGNTIKKAYLCHSKIKKLSPGDILLFYRSQDIRAVTTIGITEMVYNDVTSAEEAMHYIGKRSVYSVKEIAEMTRKPTKVILFMQHFNLPKPVPLEFLKRENIIGWAPQSISEIEHKEYQQIKKTGGIDESFTID